MEKEVMEEKETKVITHKLTDKHLALSSTDMGSEVDNP